ncbi:Divalent-cation tolerance protein CutA [Candidatus Nitrospira inopinata]|uniref:Divalent-cation tolerance protein CutA n=2 Tax=Candidatus Nitrospira inopinata TaxID=1715989 RepID=A0A0S4KVI4_9BACT|nr:Divalent-cation tolerance protein CutA [Candidatus Nitrospira inopinata]
MALMNDESKEVLVVMVTAPNQEEADRLAEQIVHGRLAACATTVAGAESTYWWEGKLVKEREVLLLLKTTVDKFSSLQQTIQRIHPYKVPEIIALPIKDGLPQYLEWVRQETN